MKIFFLPIFLLACFSASFAQSNCTIKKAYAYYNVSMPGAQMADENGNPIPPKPIITRIIYVEYSGSKMPKIESVLYNNIALNYNVMKINAKTISIGYKKLNPGNIIKAKKGNSLLQIDLQPFEGKTMPEINCKNIIIKSKAGGKLCRFFLGSEKEFVTAPSY